MLVCTFVIVGISDLTWTKYVSLFKKYMRNYNFGGDKG
jgi:hypothetical protein